MRHELDRTRTQLSMSKKKVARVSVMVAICLAGCLWNAEMEDLEKERDGELRKRNEGFEKKV